MSRPYSKGRSGGRGGMPFSNHFGGGRHNPHFKGNNNIQQGGRGRQAGGRQAGGGGNQSNRNQHQQSSGPNAATDVMKTLLNLLFEKSYAAVFTEETGHLVLSNMRASPDLVAVQKSVDFNSVAFCRALAEAIREKFANSIRILQLDGNNIRKPVLFLNALVDADIHRGIAAISMAENDITDLHFLGALKNYESLVEVLLASNPVVSVPNYRKQVTRQLPRLQSLDMEPIVRSLLGLPNPTQTAANPMALDVLQNLEQTLLACGPTKEYQYAHSLYAPTAVFSVSRNAEPIPSKLRFDALRNGSELSKEMRNVMQGDMSKLRRAINWRNLLNDVQSFRSVAKGRAEAIQKLKDLCSANTSYLRVEHMFDPNFNAAFLEVGMKVPVCVLTVHGKLRYIWNPINQSTHNPVLPAGAEPFVACFFDRTMALTWNQQDSTWSVTNDMVFMRPDNVVAHEDGSPSAPLFFANSPTRIELLRRRLLPEASSEAMATLTEGALTDLSIQELTFRLRQLPPDQLQIAVSSAATVQQALSSIP